MAFRERTASASSCRVDCNDGPECHVTAPAANATVTDCTQATCIVACGNVGPASYSGTTATWNRISYWLSGLDTQKSPAL